MTLERPDRAVRMSPELMEQLFTRDSQGRRLRVDWGEPGADGFYEPIFWCDHDDDLLEQERARALPVIEAARAALPYLFNAPLDGALDRFDALRAALAAYDGSGYDSGVMSQMTIGEPKR